MVTMHVITQVEKVIRELSKVYEGGAEQSKAVEWWSSRLHWFYVMLPTSGNLGKLLSSEVMWYPASEGPMRFQKFLPNSSDALPELSWTQNQLMSFYCFYLKNAGVCSNIAIFFPAVSPLPRRGKRPWKISPFFQSYYFTWKTVKTFVGNFLLCDRCLLLPFHPINTKSN